jgi:shikimate dehydrogenase
MRFFNLRLSAGKNYFYSMKLYGLIGYPLGHSFSKKYFEEKFANEGLSDCAFELFPLNTIEAFKQLLAEEKTLHGVAVTIPYKETVMQFLNEIDSVAQAIGAVNCIQFSEGKLKGYNTDVIGFEQSLIPLLKPHHTKALILGSGGSSKAVRFALAKNNIEYKIVSRSANETVGAINYQDLDAAIMNEYTIVINCSPVGMYPNEHLSPEIPYDLITERHLLYDLTYKPEKTKFLEKGEECGAAIKNGFEMLVLQAKENWKIWNR